MEQEKALVVPTVTELKIPTTKLNFNQEKRYREWGVKTLEEIETIALDIEEQERDRYTKENREEIIKDVLKKNTKFVNVHTFVITKVKAIKQIELAAKKDFGKLQQQIDILQTQKDKLEADSNDTTRNLFAEITNKLNEFDDNTTPDEIDFDALESMELGETRNDDFNFDILDYRDDVLEPEIIVDSSYVSDKLEEDFIKHAKSIEQIKRYIKEMKGQLEEVLLFDESKLKPLFEGIIAMRRKVKAKQEEMNA